MNEFRFSCLQSLAENRPPESNIMSLNQKKLKRNENNEQDNENSYKM